MPAQSKARAGICFTAVLTPALSCRREGNDSSAFENPRLDWPDGVPQTRNRDRGHPLPGGEDRGEGERQN